MVYNDADVRAGLFFSSTKKSQVKPDSLFSSNFFCACKYVYVIISPYLIKKNMKYKKIKRQTSLNFMIYFTK